MSHPHLPVAPRQRPGTVTAGALLTWIGAGFLISIGLLLVIADITDAQPFTRAITEATSVGFGLSVPRDITMFTLGIVLLIVGGLLVLLTVAAFLGSRVALIGLAVAAGLYVLLTFVALCDDHAPLVMLFGILWVGAITALFWCRRCWFATRGRSGAGTAPAVAPDDEGPGGAEPTGRRPGNVSTGAAMVWIAGATVLYFGVRLMWSDFAEYLAPDSTRFLLGLGLHLGLIIAAIGAALLVLAAVTFRGSRDALVALTAISFICTFLLLASILSPGPADTKAAYLLAVAWMVTAAILLWSRSAREWYRSQAR